MIWTEIDTWIVLTGVVTSMSCALIGNFLVVRRMSLMGDAISHAVLPGLAAAFILGGTRHPMPMFAGAVVAGLSTAFLTEWIHRKGRVEESSAMGVVFTTLFALGLILIVRAADTVDLDPSCVLYGSIELSPLDTLSVAGYDVPRSFVIGAGVLLLNAVLITLFYKELKISSFDPEAATAMGISARGMYYLVMALVAITTVASFESVGSILVIAMLIVPGASAHFMGVRLGSVIFWSLVIAALSAGGGHLAAITVPTWFGFPDTSTAGSMAVVSGLLFAGCFFFAPQRGVLTRWFAHRALKRRIVREDVLGSLYRWQEANPEPAPGPDMGVLHTRVGHSVVKLRHAVTALRKRKLIKAGTDLDIALTSDGVEKAGNIIRDHRLWEQYLHSKVKLPADHVHSTSEQLEHVTDPSIRKKLEKELEGARVDPHGRNIPQ
ncbi:MAG TPA: metal ABC transporter permease [Kiritimatiellia bacterium]|nr:metal ABC transporter permease [Kiritimatiellia bacterium]